MKASGGGFQLTTNALSVIAEVHKKAPGQREMARRCCKTKSESARENRNESVLPRRLAGLDYGVKDTCDCDEFPLASWTVICQV